MQEGCGNELAHADQRPSAYLPCGLQESADPLENLVRQAMLNHNLPQPKAAVWLSEGPKVDQSLLVRSHLLLGKQWPLNAVLLLYR